MIQILYHNIMSSSALTLNLKCQLSKVVGCSSLMNSGNCRSTAQAAAWSCKASKTLPLSLVLTKSWSRRTRRSLLRSACQKRQISIKRTLARFESCEGREGCESCRGRIRAGIGPCQSSGVRIWCAQSGHQMSMPVTVAGSWTVLRKMLSHPAQTYNQRGAKYLCRCNCFEQCGQS